MALEIPAGGDGGSQTSRQRTEDRAEGQPTGDHAEESDEDEDEEDEEAEEAEEDDE